MTTLIHTRVKQSREGKNPKTICRLASGWVVLGDVQFLPGYSLLLPDPVVPDLNALDLTARTQYLADMSLIGDALLSVTDSFRMNYEILGNAEAALHAHIFPRYHHEEETLRKGTVWSYDWDAAPIFDADRDADIMARIRTYLESVGASV